MIEMETNYNNKAARTFYQSITSIKRGEQTKTIICKDKEGNLIGEMDKILNRWTEYFTELLNVNENEETEIEEIDIGEQIQIESPELDEIRKVIGQMKNNKASGVDQVPAEMLKYGGDRVIQEVHNIITEVWQEERIPQNWTEAVVTPIFKKGDKTSCTNYRGIALLNTAYKVLASLLKKKLDFYMEKVVGEYQAGFRQGRSTTDQIFTLKQIGALSEEYQITMHLLFIDLKQAYDAVSRTQLYRTMHEFGIPKKLIRLVKITLTNTTNRVRIHGKLAEQFVTNNGLRQGDPLSTLLFNLVLEGIIRKAKLTTGTITTKEYQYIAYATI